MKTVLITGGAGYVGSVLFPRLLEDGYNVIIYDAMFFGDEHVRIHPNLKLIRGDIRDTERFRACCSVCDTVIHLACISNDPSFELDESLSRTMNYECFEPLVLAAKAGGVKRFINCSTSSVYGISDAPDVREDHTLVPITLYNTYKAKCEPLLFKHQSDDFTCVTIRPSTICGYSSRQRLDLAVNILTNLAVNKGVITVYGGKQMRPNLHIQDMVECYARLIEAPKEKIAGQIFNVGAVNLTIARLAELVAGIVGHIQNRQIEIETKQVLDERSYQVNSDKIKDVLGFVPKHTVAGAIRDLIEAFSLGLLPNSLEDDKYYNVQRMRKVWKQVYASAPPSKFDPTAGHMSEIDMLRMR